MIDNSNPFLIASNYYTIFPLLDPMLAYLCCDVGWNYGEEKRFLVFFFALQPDVSAGRPNPLFTI